MRVQSSELGVQSGRRLTLTPTLSLMARGKGERGENKVFPIMLSLSKHLLTFCTVLIISACGNGPTSPSATISFSGTNPGSNSVYMTQNSSLSSGDILAIDVEMNNLSSNVYGAAFDVDFDSSKITYDSYAAGSFLENGGDIAVASRIIPAKVL